MDDLGRRTWPRAVQWGPHMATIIEFRSGMRSGAHPPSGRHRGAASAEIVFFPGVRYERWEEASQETKPTRKTKKRDKLELRD